MKAQRRHELQDNELAKVIKQAPTFWQESGGKFLAICVAVVVIVVLIRYRISSNREAAMAASQNLSQARGVISELERMAQISAFAPGELVSQRQKALFNDANNTINNAISLSDDRKLQSEALVAKGDLNWTLATLPPPSGATTQPDLIVKDPSKLIEDATEAYRTVVNNYADQKYASIAARFGLAAIAENRRDFNAAKAQYDQLALDTKDMQAYQQIAAIRLNMLERVREPVRFAKPASAPAVAGLPATLPVGIAAPTTAKAQATTVATTAPAPSTTQSTTQAQ